MQINNLWNKIKVSKLKESFLKDIQEGKVPELPYYIVNQTSTKEKIGAKIQAIDGDRMSTSYMTSAYGNGKTNLFKYLELFFNRENKIYNIDFLFSRADPERFDLVVFLLKKIEDEYIDLIIAAINEIYLNKFHYAELAYNFQETFREIKDYTKKLFEKQYDDLQIRELLHLGTGRLTNKRYFTRYNLAPLTDYNRREILVLFLNFLSYKKKYLIFAIDEVEKIPERSKIRFNHFLTSYRELIDLFGKINGHYLILAITEGEGTQKIEGYQAVYTRIKPDILSLEPIKEPSDKKELINYLSEIFGVNNNEQELLKKVNKLDSLTVYNNRLLIQEASKIILNPESQNQSLKQLLEQYSLIEDFEYTYDNLIKDDAFKYIHRKFFSPLEYYLDFHNRYDILNRQEKYFKDSLLDEIQYFIFNDDKDNIENELDNIKDIIIKEKFENGKLIIYSPEKLELNYNEIIDANINVSYNVIDYQPEKLLTLLEMFRENIDLQDNLDVVISAYTKNQL